MFSKIAPLWNKADKYDKYSFFVIAAATLITLIIASISAVTGDPCWFLNAAKFIAENGKIPLFEPIGRPVFWPPPLFHLIASSFYTFNISIKLISPIFGCLTLIYTFLTAKKLFNSKIAFYSIIFLSFIPIFLYHSSIPYMATMVCFFVTASAYHLLNNQVLFSGIFAGLALSTKFTGFFIFPLSLTILVINYSRKRSLFIKKTAIFSISAFLFGSAWYIRNWIVFGNPLYPHLSFLFKAKAGTLFAESVSSPSILNLFDIHHYISMYLELFGVPAGNLGNLFLFNIPFIGLFIAVWLIATFIFISLFLIGIAKSKFKDQRTIILLVWVASFFLFAVMNIIINGGVWLRHSIPFLPAIAIFWALGLSFILSKSRAILKKLIFIFIIICIIGFAGTEIVKASLVSGLWEEYTPDFKWVSANTSKESIVLVPYGDCYAYNFNRFTEEYYSVPYVNSTRRLSEENISYIWVNQYMDFYGGIEYSSAYPEDFISEISSKYEKVYENKDTKTEVYKVR